ncbi:GntR family transcriptional regulator [Pararoseomonas indoligenes]|uniref:GntR family transcriptional regulator n=1 Tax=Roseomonas indoligenes TaxID=2820811 RepID=A0A940N3B7_9PROT|nr:GntR family transcriptional regulator [Pararoseomonas indoligenes]MBP0494405.1 GntR family transcriptional regulator [Pararoseomonas indoligenes]
MPEDREVSSTQASRVYARLRDDVIAGALAPGSKLALDGLRARYGVGMTPLREALYRLSATLLVEAHDQRGFRVAALNLVHFEQVVCARERLETLMLEDSIRAGDLAWAERVEASHAALRALPMYASAGSDALNPDWRRAHHAFHYEILSGSRHFIQDMFHAILWDHSSRYRNILRPPPLDEALLRTDHARLAEAVLARDGEMAVLVLCRHIRHGSAAILKALQGAAGDNFENT